MIMSGHLALIDGLYGSVDMATQEDRERFDDDAGGSGLIIYIPFSGVNQTNVEDSVVEMLTERKKRQ